MEQKINLPKIALQSTLQTKGKNALRKENARASLRMKVRQKHGANKNDAHQLWKQALQSKQNDLVVTEQSCGVTTQLAMACAHILAVRWTCCSACLNLTFEDFDMDTAIGYVSGEDHLPVCAHRP